MAGMKNNSAVNMAFLMAKIIRPPKPIEFVTQLDASHIIMNTYTRMTKTIKQLFSSRQPKVNWVKEGRIVLD